MLSTDLRQACLNRGPKVIKPGMVLAVEFLSLDELPQPLDQIQVGEYEGRYSKVIPSSVASACTTAFRW